MYKRVFKVLRLRSCFLCNLCETGVRSLSTISAPALQAIIFTVEDFCHFFVSKYSHMQRYHYEHANSPELVQLSYLPRPRWRRTSFLNGQGPSAVLLAAVDLDLGAATLAVLQGIRRAVRSLLSPFVCDLGGNGGGWSVVGRRIYPALSPVVVSMFLGIHLCVVQVAVAGCFGRWLLALVVWRLKVQAAVVLVSLFEGSVMWLL